MQRTDDGLDVFALLRRFGQHPDLVGPFVLQQFIFQMKGFRELSAHDGEVDLRKAAVFCDLRAQRAQRLRVLAEHHKARRIAVQPVHGGWHEAFFHARHVIAFFDQVIYRLVRQRVFLFRAVAVNEQAEGLAEHQHVFVLVGDRKLALGRVRPLFLRERIQIVFAQIDLQHVSFREQRLLFHPLSVYLYVFADGFVNEAERRVAQVFLQEAVQPLSCVVCGYRYLSHN